jgi:hypothetical protein
MTVYYGTIRDDGQIQADVDLVQDAGRRVKIEFIDEPGKAQGITIKELRNAPFIGEWADRDDIGDTAEFAEKLRERSQRRSHGDD